MNEKMQYIFMPFKRLGNFPLDESFKFDGEQSIVDYLNQGKGFLTQFFTDSTSSKMYLIKKLPEYGESITIKDLPNYLLEVITDNTLDKKIEEANGKIIRTILINGVEQAPDERDKTRVNLKVKTFHKCDDILNEMSSLDFSEAVFEEDFVFDKYGRYGIVNGISNNEDGSQILNINIIQDKNFEELLENHNISKESHQDIRDLINTVSENSGKIDFISVNGTDQTIDENKRVNINIPTAITDLSDSEDLVRSADLEIYATKESVKDTYTKPADGIPKSDLEESIQNSLSKADSAIQSLDGYATEEYVDKNGGKIDKILVNSEEQQISNKTVNINIPTKISELNNDQEFVNKNFVNSSISTATATFRGTFDSKEALDSATVEKDLNDYAYVRTLGTKGIYIYTKYKATLNEDGNYIWKEEYQLNTSGFTAEQWAAITSGITPVLVEQISTNKSNIDSKYTKPANGISSEDLSESVKASLSKADSAIQSLDGYATEEYVDKNGGKIDFISVNGIDQTIDSDKRVKLSIPTSIDALSDSDDLVRSADLEIYATKESVNAKYTKPTDGIPSEDLSQSVQDSLSSIENKIEKQDGYGLSKNDFTDSLKTKLENIKSLIEEQTLTEEEKNTARTNIGAGTSSFDGTYESLTGKPDIKVPGAGILTITQNGVEKGTFSADSSKDIVIEISVNSITTDNIEQGEKTFVLYGGSALD